MVNALNKCFGLSLTLNDIKYAGIEQNRNLKRRNHNETFNNTKINILNKKY